MGGREVERFTFTLAKQSSLPPMMSVHAFLALLGCCQPTDASSSQETSKHRNGRADARSCPPVHHSFAGRDPVQMPFVILRNGR